MRGYYPQPQREEPPDMLTTALGYLAQLNQLQQGNEQAATSRFARMSGQALLPGQIEMQGAQRRNLGAESAMSEARLPYVGQQADDLHQQAMAQLGMIPGQMEQQQAATRHLGAQTQGIERMLPGQVAHQGAETAQTQAQTALTNAQTPHVATHADDVHQQAMAALAEQQTKNAQAGPRFEAEQVFDKARGDLLTKQAAGYEAGQLAQNQRHQANTIRSLAEPASMAGNNPAVAAMMNLIMPGVAQDAQTVWWNRLDPKIREAMLKAYPGAMPQTQTR